MASLQDFHDVSIMFLWDYYGTSISFPWYSIGFLWCCYGIKRRFLWDFHDVSMIVLWDSYGIPIGVPWCFFDISMRLLWELWRNSMGFLRVFSVVLMLFSCYLYNLSIKFFVGFPLGFHDISMGLLWDFKWKYIAINWKHGKRIESKSKSIEWKHGKYNAIIEINWK